MTLMIKYGSGLTSSWQYLHYKIFSVVFIFWLIVLFVHNLFDERSLKRYHVLFFNFVSAAFFSFVVAVIYFYTQPDLLLTPRRTLLLLILIAFGLIFLWHIAIKLILKNNIIESFYLFSLNDELSELRKEIERHNYLGLKVAGEFTNIEKLGEGVNNNVSVIVSDLVLAQPQLAKRIYELRERGMPVYSEFNFTELLLRRIPLRYLQESWFFTYVGVREGRLQSVVRRIIDLVVGVTFGLVFLLTLPLFFLLIKLSSKGMLFFVQGRVGKNNRAFKVYKYRTMDQSSLGKGWTQTNDPRITKIGKFLRLTHLDELPQFINLLKGDMSIVGPRPEQIEIVADLNQKIPFYNERHLVKPGLSGWGQLNIYAGSLEETKTKLEYDLYYLKHRSLLFDLEIILKTIYLMFVSRGR